MELKISIDLIETTRSIC